MKKEVTKRKEVISMALNGITEHARRDTLDRPFLTKREIMEAVEKGLVIKIPAEKGRVAFCHTGEKVAVIADAKLSSIITYSPGGHFFRIIDKVKAEISGGVVKRKELPREILLILKDGTKVFMNKKQTRIRRILPPKYYRS